MVYRTSLKNWYLATAKTSGFKDRKLSNIKLIFSSLRSLNREDFRVVLKTNFSMRYILTMSSYFFYFTTVLFYLVKLEAHMNHHSLPIPQEWREENIPPFDELMITWNATRPTHGNLLFYVSVKTDGWSPYLLYASWGNDGQSSFTSKLPELPVKVYQDALQVLEGHKATAFQIKIVSEGSDLLNNIFSLHVYTNGDKLTTPSTFSSPFSIDLEILGLSQMTLNHPRFADLCSPTSTTAVIRYLSQNYEIDPLFFAQNVWDSGFDIYGNWVFNVAEASTFLGPKWSCWVERLKNFDDIYNHLSKKVPVIVSVRGPLPGSAKPYAKGHLLAVIGYDSLNKKVICMDPAFSSNDETIVSYDLSDFVTAWNRRGNLAYIFCYIEHN
jgi:hypothetical protein